MRARTVNENVNFEKGRNPKEVMGIGRLFNINFYYADHPSIEDQAVVSFIDDLESTIYDIDSEANYEIKIDDGFSDGHINFKSSKLEGDDMLDMLKAKREAAFGNYSVLASWDFGEVEQGLDTGGELFDSDNYSMGDCQECGEELNDEGYCNDCDY